MACEEDARNRAIRTHYFVEAMPDRTGKRREPPISYRPPKELRGEFYRRVESSGLSTSAFITKALFDQEPGRQSRRPALEQQLLARLLGEAGKIRNELNAISRQPGDGERNTELLENAVQELTVIRAALLKAMGRNP